MANGSMGLMQGTVDVLILKTLSAKPLHGYAISEVIHERSNGDLAVEDAALYQALHRPRTERIRRIRVGNLGHKSAARDSTRSARRAESSCARRSSSCDAMSTRCSPFWTPRSLARCRARFGCRSNHAHGLPPEIDEELAFHLKAMAARLEREGMAGRRGRGRRHAAGLVISNSQNIIAAPRTVRREGEKRRMTIADELKQDLRYALRWLRAAPGFAVVALTTLALGIGANTAIFSVVRGVLLDPLPFAAADRIVRVWNANPTDRIEKGPYSEPDFLDLRAATKLTETIGGFFFVEAQSGVDLTGSGAPERLSAALVTPGFFETLRPRPLLGRVLVEEEHRTGSGRFVVIGYGLWQRRFGGDAGFSTRRSR
jgi:hypothetical protein